MMSKEVIKFLESDPGFKDLMERCKDKPRNQRKKIIIQWQKEKKQGEE